MVERAPDDEEAAAAGSTPRARGPERDDDATATRSRSDGAEPSTDGGRRVGGDAAVRRIVGADGVRPHPETDTSLPAPRSPAPAERDRQSDPTQNETATTGDTAESVRERRRRLRAVATSRLFREIRSRSRFADLQVVTPADGGRYADCIRVRASHGSEERGLSLGVIDRPEDDAAFAERIADALDRWARASDADGIVSLADWGRAPRPWLARQPVAETLPEWSIPDEATRLRYALQIAENVVALHREGVVHGGLDAGNVVHPDGPLTETPRPLLNNVGLMHVFRTCFEPSAYLDPRYAAPEYFDREYGDLDHRTDVYGLGAVLYRLCTGRAPFRGTYADVRRGVLERSPEPPTAHNASLPDPIDDVLGTALATDKSLRYGSAAELRADLSRICERSGYRIEP